jgi:hypothetical protein
MKLLEIISVEFSVSDKLLIRYFAFVRYWRKNGSIMGLYIGKQTYESGGKYHTTLSLNSVYELNQLS